MHRRPETVEMDRLVQRRLAVNLFNYVWTLLEADDRSPAEDAEMVNAAHASRFFWETIGEPAHHERGDWQISRVYCCVGRPEPALHHAELCLATCERHGIGDWDIAYAHEAMARAHGLAGSHDASARHREMASRAAELIAGAEDRELAFRDIATLPA